MDMNASDRPCYIFSTSRKHSDVRGRRKKHRCTEGDQGGFITPNTGEEKKKGREERAVASANALHCPPAVHLRRAAAGPSWGVANCHVTCSVPEQAGTQRQSTGARGLSDKARGRAGNHNMRNNRGVFSSGAELAIGKESGVECTGKIIEERVSMKI